MTDLVYLDEKGAIQIKKEFAIRLEEFNKIKEEFIALEQEVKLGVQTLFDTTKHKGIMLTESGIQVTHKADYIKTALDTTRLKKEKPEIYAEYAKVSTVSGSVSLKLNG